MDVGRIDLSENYVFSRTQPQSTEGRCRKITQILEHHRSQKKNVNTQLRKEKKDRRMDR